MTVTRTDKIKVLGEITAVADTVESGVGYSYLGTNKGALYKYNQATGAISTLQRLHGKITCMLWDSSTYLYVGLADGKILRYTISSGAITTLYEAPVQEPISMAIYSSTLWVGLSGGQFVSVTVS